MSLIKLSDVEWDELLKLAPYKSVYSSSNWFKNITKSLGGNYVLLLYKKEDSQFLIPCFIGQPWSEGVRIGAIGYGGPIPLNNDKSLSFHELISLVESYFSMTCTAATSIPYKALPVVDNKDIKVTKTQILSLGNMVESFNNKYSGNVRTSIRKAIKSSLTVKLLSSNEASVALSLIHSTQMRVKSPYRTPENLFENIAFESGIGKCYGAFLENKVIAVTLALTSAYETAYYLNGWDPGFSNLCPNHLLIHHMINEAVLNKCDFFNFGESPYDSLLESKKRWGPSEYYIQRWSLTTSN